MAKTFLEKYNARIEKVEKRLKSYLEDPDEENVHDLRTATRRMVAALDALPKEIRNEDKTQEFLGAFRKLSKQNTGIRDLDIIVSKISKREKDPAIERLSKNVLEARKTQVQHAHEYALEVQKEIPPILRKRDISDPAIRKRLDKLVSRLTSRINNRLPKVLSDPANMEELHLLRIDARRLRYVLELIDNKETPKLVKLLESWQDVLGPIHDNDVTIEYLRSSADSREVQILLNEEMNERKSHYRKFGSLAKEIHP